MNRSYVHEKENHSKANQKILQRPSILLCVVGVYCKCEWGSEINLRGKDGESSTKAFKSYKLFKS